MTEAHRTYREQLGALALGQLPPAEAEELRAHLASCGDCRAELDEIAPLVGALRQIDPERVAVLDSPPADLGRRIEERIDRERSGPRRRRGARPASNPWGRRPHRRVATRLAAAAALVTAVAIVAVVVLPSGPPMEPVTFARPAAGVEVAEANLIAHTWGTEIVFVASGLQEGRTYEVAFRDRAGRSVPAGTFIGVGEQPITCELNAALLRAEAAAVTVASSDGAVVLEADLV